MDSKEKDKQLEIVSRRRFVKNAPDKVRLAGSLIKGKNLSQAMDILRFTKLAAAKPLLLILKQGLSLAKDKDIPTENLQIKIIRIDEGPKLKRRRIVHQGRSTAILKRMAHVTVILTDDEKSKIKNQKSKRPEDNNKSKRK